MDALVLDLKKRYTFADYLTWTDDIRRELIDGFIKMVAGTSLFHGRVSVMSRIRSRINRDWIQFS